MTFAVGQVTGASSAYTMKSSYSDEQILLAARRLLVEVASYQPEPEDSDVNFVSCAARGLGRQKIFHEQRNGAVWLITT